MEGSEFPRIVYRAAATPGQIDHPGFIARRIADAAELDAAIGDGWLLLPVVPEPVPDAPRIVRKKVQD